jgi:CheY-like chemotaxis protein
MSACAFRLEPAPAGERQEAGGGGIPGLGRARTRSIGRKIAEKLHPDRRRRQCAARGLGGIPQRAWISVKAIETGAAAVHAIAKHTGDIVLLDIEMPGCKRGAIAQYTLVIDRERPARRLEDHPAIATKAVSSNLITARRETSRSPSCSMADRYVMADRPTE